MGGATPKVGVPILFAENCMKMKEFGPWGHIPGAPLRHPNGKYMKI